MRAFGLAILLVAGCHVVRPAPLSSTATEPHRWVLVERSYDEVEPWIQDSGDASLAGGETTLVFEPVPIEGAERLRLLVESSRCAHRLRCTGEIPQCQQIGDPVALTLSIDCAPCDVHRVDIIPSRPGVQVIAIRGAIGELPNLAGFFVRGAAKVTVNFTADSRGPGGIKAILSEVDNAPK